MKHSYSPGIKYESSKYHTDLNEFIVATAPRTSTAAFATFKYRGMALPLSESL